MSKKALAGVSGAGSAVWAVFEFGFTNLDVVMSGLVPLAYRVAPRLAWLPAARLEDVVVALSVVGVVFAVVRLYDRAKDRFA